MSGGVPSGGTTGQILRKKSNLDNDAEWANESTPPEEVFIAVYSSTTSAEIEAAYQAGKAIFAKSGINEDITIY